MLLIFYSVMAAAAAVDLCSAVCAAAVNLCSFVAVATVDICSAW